MNRPEALNAINLAMIEAFDAALAEAAADPLVRVLVLTGAGKAFCVGADIKELRTFETDPAIRDRFYALAPGMFRRLEEFPCPVIAAVNGIAAAGGFELCCYADLVIAVEGVPFGDAHANYVGFGPVSAVLAPRQLPGKKAAELLLTGDMWKSQDLAALGFVNRVVPPDALMEEVGKYADKIAAKQPLALRAVKVLMRGAAAGASPDILLSHAFESAQRIFGTEDFAEGLAAFDEKRKPVFRGR
jgi:enoyl-CoA hydratase/carnithine racemase